MTPQPCGQSHETTPLNLTSICTGHICTGHCQILSQWQLSLAPPPLSQTSPNHQSCVSAVSVNKYVTLEWMDPKTFHSRMTHTLRTTTKKLVNDQKLMMTKDWTYTAGRHREVSTQTIDSRQGIMTRKLPSSQPSACVDLDDNESTVTTLRDSAVEFGLLT